MRTRLIAIMGVTAAALIAPAAAHAQNPLRSIFDCNNPGNKQQGGAIAGALIGGLLGNQINDNDRTTGTVVGGLLGAAAGSAIGCQMSSSDTTRATDATRQALNSNRSSTWRGPNGTTGRIDIVDSYRQADASGYDYDRYDNDRDRYNERDRYSRTPSVEETPFAYGVQQPVNYRMMDSRYEARSRTNVRAAPSLSARVLTQLRPGEDFDALARVSGGWLLASRGGQAIGYVAESVVFPTGNAEVYAYGDQRRAIRPASGQICRTFDQTIERFGQVQRTDRYTACQTSAGEWIIQS